MCYFILDTHGGYMEKCMKKVKYSVEGMNCGKCVNKIKEGLSSLVSSLEISLDDKEVIVVGDDSLSNMKIKKSIEELGFSVVGMNKES